MTKSATAIVLLTMAIVLTGCATSRVHFEQPAGARLLLEPTGYQSAGKEYELPTAIDLPQKDSPMSINSDSGRRPIRMVLSDDTKLKGYLYVYRLDMDQLEKLAEVTFRLTDEQISKIKKGDAVTIIGYSARKRPVYKVNVGLDR